MTPVFLIKSLLTTLVVLVLFEGMAGVLQAKGKLVWPGLLVVSVVMSGMGYVGWRLGLVPAIIMLIPTVINLLAFFYAGALLVVKGRSMRSTRAR